MELHNGDIIVFKDNINIQYINTTFNLSFYSNNTLFNQIFISYSSYVYYWMWYRPSTSTTSGEVRACRKMSTMEWDNQEYKTIIINGNQTITDEAFINWLYENTVSGLPPRVMENMYAVVGSQLNYSFSNIGNVVGTVVNNGVLTIFTLGIFIMSLAVGILRRLSRRKSFKK